MRRGEGRGEVVSRRRAFSPIRVSGGVCFAIRLLTCNCCFLPLFPRSHSPTIIDRGRFLCEQWATSSEDGGGDGPIAINAVAAARGAQKSDSNSTGQFSSLFLPAKTLGLKGAFRLLLQWRCLVQSVSIAILVLDSRG